MGGSGRLLVAATPIGNPADASPRLRAALAEADVVAAEDTRRLRRLAASLGVSPAGRVVSHFEGNEGARARELLEELRRGATVLLVSDAGAPLLSDPGYPLVRAAVRDGIVVHALPGPSAAVAALMVSGLPADRWCFEGFLPRRAAARRARLAGLADEARTMVFFEAPHRLAASLADLVGAFGAAREAVACRELTKTHEEVRRGPLGELLDWAENGGPRGEITLVVAGVQGRPAPPGEALAAEVALRRAAGKSTRAAVDEVAAAHGLARRAVYEAVNGSRPAADAF